MFGSRRDVLAFLFFCARLFFGLLPPATKRIFKNMHIMNWQSKGRVNRGGQRGEVVGVKEEGEVGKLQSVSMAKTNKSHARPQFSLSH